MSEWTQERIERATRMWLDGRSAKAIAEELGGLTRNAVIGKIDRLGLMRADRGTGAQTARTAPTPPSRPTTTARPPRKPATPKAPVPKTSTAEPITVAPAAIPVVPAVTREPVHEPVRIMDLRDYMCRWPIGDPNSDSFRYCGRRNKPGGPYCEGHVRMAYMPSSRVRPVGQAVSSARR